ncbi:poly(hydroxyalkanoate) granule-associated protein [Agitococcus lubricus]|uniref:Poly(Hydroxyalkanoate) granule-associated protein n=2 Tax=Agitococcus lubricus TaxID=1077255 RepID=A0A2T5J1I7_9GAMM|nr:phasin family protein [Agitococcus lubricus]PTQ90306.1 poly(hydroxyalkanoate) granule-associated protein [Agitococcus lubricus]
MTDKQRKLTSATELRKYTQEIWLAGLGAFSRAEEEGGKLFDSLVKVGEELESKTRDIADNTVETVVEARDKVLEKASDTREKVERAFDDRLAAALGRLGIPSQREIEAVNQRLDTLTQVLQQLTDQMRQNQQK